VFVATSMAGCSGVFHASSTLFYPEQTSFPDGVAPKDFVVVVEDRSRSEPFQVVYLRNLEAQAKPPATLRLSVAAYDYTDGDPWGFKVTDQSSAHQVVEVTHRHFKGVTTRYRVEGNRITPLAYRDDGGLILVMILIPVFLVCLWLAWRAARWTSRTFRRRFDAGARSA
jgi:hypothetical protein